MKLQFAAISPSESHVSTRVHSSPVPSGGLPGRVLAQLRRNPLLATVDDEELCRMNPPPQLLHFQAGETLRQGEAGCDYYVLIEGRLKTFETDSRGVTMATAIVHPCEGVGDEHLLSDAPRSVTVVACVASEIVRFPRESFLNLIESNPVLANMVARVTIRRLKHQYNSEPKGVTRSRIAVVPITEGLDTNALAVALARGLRCFGRTVAIDARGSRLRAPHTGPGQDSEHGIRCEQIEREHEFVVYAATNTLSDGWSRHCIRRCDLVLLAADSAAQPHHSPVLGQLLHDRQANLSGRFDLLVVHGNDWNRACPTRHWIDRTEPSEHHHVRAATPSDFSRLARILTGAANNLVLSGGGARAFSQIGALRALAEAGIPIDRACGSSMGAFVSALYCRGGNFDDLAGLARESMIRLRPWRDVTLPLLSISTGRSLAKVWTTICKSWQIEDMPYRYFCLSSDLGQADLVEHFSGSVWAALRSSCAMPGLFAPFLIDGRMLADGGVLNNLPVDIMREHFSGKIIAVDASFNNRLQYGARYEMRCPSGFEILWDKINLLARKEPMPNIIDVLYRTGTLSCDRHTKVWREKANMLIAPPVQNFRVSDFARFDELVELGYRYTIQALEKADQDFLSAPLRPTSKFTANKGLRRSFAPDVVLDTMQGSPVACGHSIKQQNKPDRRAGCDHNHEPEEVTLRRTGTGG